MHRLDPFFGTSDIAGEIPRPAGPPTSAVKRASTILAEQFLVVFLVVFVTSLTACLALLALDAFQGASIVLNQMIDATKVVVFLDPKMSSQNAESIGVRLKTMPGVGGLWLRTKEEAFTGIGDASMGIFSASKEIPFPDAWMLSLQMKIRDRPDGLPSLMWAAEQLQESAGRLLGVQSVRFDRVWVAELDRWISLFREATIAVLIFIFCTLALLLFGPIFFFLRLLRVKQFSDIPNKYWLRVGVFAYIGVCVASLSGISTFLLHALAALSLNKLGTHTPNLLHSWLTAFYQSRTEDTLIVAAALLVSATVAVLFAARTR